MAIPSTVKKAISKIAPPLAHHEGIDPPQTASPTTVEEGTVLSPVSSTHSDEKSRKPRFSGIISNLRKTRSVSRGHSLDSRPSDDLQHIQPNGAADVHPDQVSLPSSATQTRSRGLSFTEQREIRKNEREEKEEEEAEQRRRRHNEAWEKVSASVPPSIPTLSPHILAGSPGCFGERVRNVRYAEKCGASFSQGLRVGPIDAERLQLAIGITHRLYASEFQLLISICPAGSGEAQLRRPADPARKTPDKRIYLDTSQPREDTQTHSS